MSLLRRAAANTGILVAVFLGGILGAITLAFFAVWTTPISPGRDLEYPGPADGIDLLLPFLAGAFVGFWGGALLAIFAILKLSASRKARQI